MEREGVVDDEHERGGDDEFALFDDAVAGDARDPYPELAQARREHPVQRLDASLMPHEEGNAVFFVYRYDDVAQVLRDGETFSSAHIIDLIMGPVMGDYIMLGMDNPEHRRYRGLVATAFRQKVLARWEDDSSKMSPTTSSTGLPNTVRRNWSGSSRSRTRRGSSHAFSDCRRRTTGNSNGGPSPSSVFSPSPRKRSSPRTRSVTTRPGSLPSAGLSRGRPDQRPGTSRARRGAPRATKRSTHSSGSCCLPGWRRRSGQPETSSSPCSRTPTNSTQFAPTGT